jgi:hypothetical protein
MQLYRHSHYAGNIEFGVYYPDGGHTPENATKFLIPDLAVRWLADSDGFWNRRFRSYRTEEAKVDDFIIRMTDPNGDLNQKYLVQDINSFQVRPMKNPTSNGRGKLIRGTTRLVLTFIAKNPDSINYPHVQRKFDLEVDDGSLPMFEQWKKNYLDSLRR